MKKTDLIKEVSKSTDVDEATVRKVFNSIVDTIKDSLFYGVDIRIKDFISFTLERRAESKRRNPQNQEPFIVPAHYKVKVTLSRLFNEKIRTKKVY